jgi:hypothetical protein
MQISIELSINGRPRKAGGACAGLPVFRNFTKGLEKSMF